MITQSAELQKATTDLVTALEEMAEVAKLPPNFSHAPYLLIIKSGRIAAVSQKVQDLAMALELVLEPVPARVEAQIVESIAEVRSGKPLQEFKSKVNMKLDE
jgi:hypothetical protein